VCGANLPDGKGGVNKKFHFFSKAESGKLKSEVVGNKHERLKAEG
jgi:hypothetical protein